MTSVEHLYRYIKSKGYQWQISCKKSGIINIGWQIKKRGVIGCEIVQNHGNFNLLFLIFAAIYNIFFLQNFMISLEKFDRRCKNTGSLGVMLWKKGAFGEKPMQKRGSVDRRMAYTGGQWECLPRAPFWLDQKHKTNIWKKKSYSWYLLYD